MHFYITVIHPCLSPYQRLKNHSHHVNPKMAYREPELKAGVLLTIQESKMMCYNTYNLYHIDIEIGWGLIPFLKLLLNTVSIILYMV